VARESNRESPPTNAAIVIACQGAQRIEGAEMSQVIAGLIWDKMKADCVAQ